MTTGRPTRVVDAHVHLWDPARTDWYPYLGSFPVHGGGDPSRMNRRFDVEAYRAESSGWNVDKFVNVAAATGMHSVDETLALDRTAADRGGPHAIVGGLPPTDTVAEAIEVLDRQMASPLLRGVRPMGGLDRPVPEREVLDALSERRLVFEVMAHPDQLRPAAEKLSRVDDLAVVVEHTGWPRSDAETERTQWRDGMAALASLGPQVVCKLSGLAMPFASVAAAALRPWLEQAIDVFGVDRCLFASNFPVDAAYGTFDELYGTFAAVTSGLGDDDRDKLFAANAERVYRF